MKDIYLISVVMNSCAFETHLVTLSFLNDNYLDYFVFRIKRVKEVKKHLNIYKETVI